MPEITPTVAIVKAHGYDIEEIKNAVGKSLDLLGGLDYFIKPGARVFLKINHLSPASPADRAIVTHPVFTEAIIDLLKRRATAITVGDDIDGENEEGFDVSGYREMCARTGVSLINLKRAGFVPVKCQGKILQELYISRAAREADIIINLAKVKTHSLTTLTCSIKNMYGLVPCGLRRRYHGDYPKIEDFSQMLVDIYEVSRAELTIVDGIIAMEGEGPGSGRPKHLGIVMAGRDGVAVDAVVGKTIGLNPENVSTTRLAGERGLGTADLGKITILGVKLEEVIASRFKLPAASSQAFVGMTPRYFSRFVIEQISPRPVILNKKCVACAECVAACPTSAASIQQGTAVINYSKCIRCMCCHEVCRYAAIVPRRQILGDAVTGLVGVLRHVLKR